MSVRGKQELRNIFVTGAVPTQQDFTDFIDSYIASINGNIPDMDGNIDVPVAFNVTSSLNPFDLPSTYEVGRTIGVYDYVKGADAAVDALLSNFDIEDGRFTVITDNFDSSGIIIQEIDTFKNGAFIPTLTRTSLDGQDAWGELSQVNSVRSINGVMPDINGNIEVASDPKDFYQAWRTGSGQTVNNGEDIILNSEGFGRGITYDNSTGIWTLLPGKIYKIDVNLRANTSNFLEFGVYSHSTSSYVSDIIGASFSVNSTFDTSSANAITQFIDSNVHQSISIRCINASNTGSTVTVGFSHATIVEI